MDAGQVLGVIAFLGYAVFFYFGTNVIVCEGRAVGVFVPSLRIVFYNR